MPLKIRFRRAVPAAAAALLLALLAVAPVRAFGPGANRPGAGHPFTNLSITSQTFAYIDAFYVDPKRVAAPAILESAFRTIEAQYPEVIIDVAPDWKSASARVRGYEKRFDLSRVSASADIAQAIDSVVGFVGERLGDDVEKDKLLYFTINGALRALDPHTNVFSMKHFKDFKVSTSGSFGGIGFTFNAQDGELVIVSPIPDTPASRAGLRSGDRIVLIDGTPTTNMSSDTAVGMMRGEPGTQVTITIAREGWPEPRDMTITREVIKIVSVESRLLGGDGPPVVYARIKNFQTDTSGELAAAIRRLETPGAAGVILDMRDNPGGLLDEAVKVADGFLDQGRIVSTRNRTGKGVVESAHADDPPFTRLPLIVLVNRGSASASEIVAAALEDSRALLLGERTFGKGSVQQAFPLTDGGGVLLTVSQYLTPGDVSIQSIGVEPDVVLEPVLVTPERLLLAPLKDHVTEGGLEHAFSTWGNARREAVASVRFLRTEPPADHPAKGRDEKERVKEPTEEERAAKVADTFEVRLARRILAAAAGRSDAATHAGLVAAARGVVEQARPEEEQKIGTALAARGIDWSGDGAPTAARLAATMPEGQILQPGATATLAVRLRNDGPAPLHRVWGRTESANPLLRNLDFAFGTLAPGETREATATVEVPGSVEERWDTVTLKLAGGAPADAPAFTGSVQTTSRPAPEYAYDYTITEENARDPKKSGDGHLEEGERVRLDLRVTNRGAVESPLLEVNLRADEKEQLLLDEVRRKIEKLAPGATAEAKLAFRVVKPLENGKVKVNLTFSDRKTGAFLADGFEIPTAGAYVAKDSRVPPRIALAEPTPLVTDAPEVAVGVNATDSGAVKDVVIYRGEKKLSYSRNSGKAVPFQVSVKVPLESGSNRIVIIARDDKDIPAQKVLYIYRRGGESATAMAPASAPPASPLAVHP